MCSSTSYYQPISTKTQCMFPVLVRDPADVAGGGEAQRDRRRRRRVRPQTK